MGGWWKVGGWVLNGYGSCGDRGGVNQVVLQGDQLGGAELLQPPLLCPGQP